MHYFQVAPLKIVRAGSDTFTYGSETALPVGQLVVISVGKQQLVGLIIRTVNKPSYDVKLIETCLEDRPIPVAHVELSQWMSKYYHTPLATVLQTMLPAGLTKKRRTSTASSSVKNTKRTQFVLTEDQQRAVDSITNMHDGTALLHGVTGSGKTAVYMELAHRAVTNGKSAVILVPEIALTSQLVMNFTSRFDSVLVTHSKQTEAERHLVWRVALHAEHPTIVIGPRSALFLPLQDIGLIVIDEEHEPSYKQDQSPRYAAQLVASQLARKHNAPLVLGSATPTICDYYLAKQAKRPIIPMNTRATDNATPPSIELVDMTKRNGFKRHRFMSDLLLSRIDETLQNGRQVLMFHNRRGSASVTLCQTCGWQAGCPTCFVPLTLHADRHQLRCHICGYDAKVPTSCPVDGSIEIVHKGIGTKLIESELRRLYPKAMIMRFDGDSENGQTVDAMYDQLKDGTIDIIIGTQVVAKGLDLPELRVVGIVQADAGLSLPDYGASERAFQLLAQAIGRVGRFSHATSVVVQSYQPEHPVITAGLRQDYESFYKTTLELRKRSHFPPFTYLLKLTCVYKTEASAVRASRELANILRQRLPSDVRLLGPTPAFYERVRDTYRWQLVLKSPKRAHLIAALEHVPKTHWQFELDPISLL